MDKMRVFRDKFLGHKQNETLSIVDLGSMDVTGNSYREYFNFPSWSYQGMDITAGNNVDIVLKNPYRWCEVKTKSVDVIISGQAFEHIEFFWLTTLEIARVLKPGGICCIIAPSSGPIHRHPVDCWRFYPDGFAALAKFSNLEVLEVYSQTRPTGYPDGSDQWQDLVMVARKPMNLGVRLRIKAWIRYWLLYLILP